MCLTTCIPGFSLESSFRPLSSWPLVLTKLRPRNCSGHACRSVQPLAVERRSTRPAVAGHLVVARLAVVKAGRRLGRSLEALCLAFAGGCSAAAAGVLLWTDGVEQSQNTVVRGRQLCTQLSFFEGSLAELLRF